MFRNSVPCASASALGALKNRRTICGPANTNAAMNGTATHSVMPAPARNPCFTRSGRPAPIFWAVKLERPLPSVVKPVSAKVFSFTAAE